MRKRTRRLGELDMSETGTRPSSDARSTPTPRTGTRSASSFYTRGVLSGRSFGPSTSFANYRINAEIVRHPRFRTPLRSTQTIPYNKLEMEAHRRSAAKAHSRFRVSAPGFFSASLLAESVFARQSQFAGNHFLPAAAALIFACQAH